VTEPASCPHCGLPVPAARGRGAGDGDGPLSSLHEEVRRIRELAEARQAEDDRRHRSERPVADSRVADSRVAELTRELAELRATVARLRGSTTQGLARSS
jgi:hypothetical protein